MINIFRKLSPDEVRWVKDLQAEVETLKRTINTLLDGGADERRERWHELHLTQSEARVLRLLLARTFATRAALWTALYWDKDEPSDPKTLDVFLTRIRHKLPFLRSELKNRPGEGYFLTPDGKHRLLYELMNPGFA